MPFNIDSFKSNISKDGYLNNNKYEVIIVPPPMFSVNLARNGIRLTSSYGVANSLRFRIDSIKAPGITILSADNNRYGVGPTQKNPYNVQFNEIGLSFITDKKADLWQFFYQWTREIFQYNPADTVLSTVGGIASAFGLDLGGIFSNSTNYSANYKEDYAALVQIYIYDNFGELAQVVNLYDAFPTAINEVNLGWGNNNQAMRIGVTLTFKEFTMTNGAII